ncbi:MAG: serine/threonine-protein kinase [Myxococcota bacterium]
MAVPTPAERLGTTLAEKYELESVIGRGGIGVVFVATHKWTGRRVAVKVLRYQHSQDPKQVQRFLREARATAQLHHPNVVDVLDMGQADDGAVYLALEFLEGETLRRRIDRDERIDQWELVDLLLPVFDALAAAHEIGLIHRDLKPDNIFLSLDSRGKLVPKLLDFGLVKSIGPQVTGFSTEVGSFLGTPAYMSPEQIRAETANPASDVWSMGVVLYEALTGGLPYDEVQAPALLVSILSDAFAPVLEQAPHVDASLAAVVEDMLEKKPEDRVPDIRTVMSRLAAAAEQAGVELRWKGANPYGETLAGVDGAASGYPTPVVTRRSTTRRRKKRSATPFVALGAVAALGVAGAIAVTVGGGSEGEEAPVAPVEGAAQDDPPAVAETAPQVTPTVVGAAPPESEAEAEPAEVEAVPEVEEVAAETAVVRLRLQPSRAVVRDSQTRETLCSGGSECRIEVPPDGERRVTVTARSHIQQRATLRPDDGTRSISLRPLGLRPN